jgi:uncharacterized phage protein gp47/JayE
MANVFKATADIVQEMCSDYKSITGITLSPTNYDNENVIKFYTDAGAISSMYAEIQRTANDFFPQTASLSGLIKALASRSMPPQIQPQSSQGQIQLTGSAAGIAITAGATQVQRVSDGAVFTCIQSGVTDGAKTANLFFESQAKGNAQNLDSLNQPFTLITPISGISTNCINTSLFLNGRDLETTKEIAARITAHDQDDNSGGNEIAYENWAQVASSEVVTAKTVRLPRGPDTVDTYITSGTTDIAAAVLAGQSISRLPSPALLATVQAYITSLNPITDDHLTKAPIETPLNVTFRFKLYDESTANRSYLTGIITQIIKIYLYSAKPLDVLSPSAIERLVDQQIGDQISERACDNLGGMNTYFTVPAVNIIVPGTLTIVGL